MMETLLEVYASERWGRAYGYRDAIYAGGWHRGQDIRKQVESGAYSISHDVLALSDGEVVHVQRHTKVGLTIVIQTKRKGGTGVYESHSHLADASVRVGDKAKAGDRLARTALAHENPGTSWGGPHDHIVLSDHYDGAWNTARKVYDPRPIIREALVVPATGGGTVPIPEPIPTTRKKANMLIVHIPDNPKTGGRNDYYVISENGIVVRFTGEGAARKIEAQIGAESAPVGQSFVDQIAERFKTLAVEIANLD